MTNKTVNVGFSYTVYDGYGDEMFSDELMLNLGEQELREVANVMKANGGYPVEMVELSTLTDTIGEKIMMEEMETRYPDRNDFGEWTYDIQEEMPEELIQAAEEYVDYKSIDFAYYLWRNGKEEKQSVQTSLRRIEFQKLQASVRENRNGDNDFDHLKVFDPQLYQAIAGRMTERINLDLIKEYGSTFPISLKEFPYQIYERL